MAFNIFTFKRWQRHKRLKFETTSKGLNPLHVQQRHGLRNAHGSQIQQNVGENNMCRHQQPVYDTNILLNHVNVKNVFKFKTNTKGNTETASDTGNNIKANTKLIRTPPDDLGLCLYFSELFQISEDDFVWIKRCVSVM